MNKISIVFAFLLISNIIFAQKKKNQAPTAKDVSPPNCIWVEKDDMSFWIDQTEVANIHWIEFLKNIQEESPEMYKKMLPDTMVWQEHWDSKLVIEEKSKIGVDTFFNNKGDTLFIGEALNPYSANYLNYSGFRFFPLVGISYEQAQEFCKWRSRVVTENYNLEKLKKLQGYHVNITFRLPTTEEWELAAQAYTSDEHGFEVIGEKRAKQLKRLYPDGWSRANTLRGKGDYAGIAWNKDKSEMLITEYIFSHFPNDFGLYNMIGNVAEMVQEKGIAKGGSWLDKLEDCKIKSHKTYEKPNAWLGFRCVCEVKITKIEQL